MKKTMKINKGNGIEAHFDFSFYYDEIPEGEWEVEASDYCRIIRLTGPGHGAKGDYGSGTLSVFVADSPDWFIKELGIKKDRRKGDRRGKKISFT